MQHCTVLTAMVVPFLLLISLVTAQQQSTPASPCTSVDCSAGLRGCQTAASCVLQGTIPVCVPTAFKADGEACANGAGADTGFCLDGECVPSEGWSTDVQTRDGSLYFTVPPDGNIVFQAFAAQRTTLSELVDGISRLDVLESALPNKVDTTTLTQLSEQIHARLSEAQAQTASLDSTLSLATSSLESHVGSVSADLESVSTAVSAQISSNAAAAASAASAASTGLASLETKLTAQSTSAVGQLSVAVRSKTDQIDASIRGLTGSSDSLSTRIEAVAEDAAADVQSATTGLTQQISSLGSTLDAKITQARGATSVVSDKVDAIEQCYASPGRAYVGGKCVQEGPTTDAHLTTCNTANAGQVRWHRSSSKLQVCDGSSWKNVYPFDLIKYRSCKDLPTGSKSGYYTIYPVQTDSPIRVYCDMDTGGGGWALAVNTGRFAESEGCAWYKSCSTYVRDDRQSDVLMPWNPWSEGYGSYGKGWHTKFSVQGGVHQFSANQYGNDLEVMFKYDDKFLIQYAGIDMSCAFDQMRGSDCTRGSQGFRFKTSPTGGYAACGSSRVAQSQWYGWTWTFNDHGNSGNCAYNRWGLLIHHPDVLYIGNRGMSAWRSFTLFEIFVRPVN